jgi:hypothetical protein
MRRWIGLVQAAYYLVTGVAPIVAYGTFEAITGPKREPWLVKMVGLLTIAIGAVIASDPAGRTPQVRRLAILAAAAYGAIDVWYAGVRRRISRVYLLDAVVEAGIIGAWLATARTASDETRPAPGDQVQATERRV